MTRLLFNLDIRVFIFASRMNLQSGSLLADIWNQSKKGFFFNILYDSKLQWLNLSCIQIWEAKHDLPFEWINHRLTKNMNTQKCLSKCDCKIQILVTHRKSWHTFKTSDKILWIFFFFSRLERRTLNWVVDLFLSLGRHY